MENDFDSQKDCFQRNYESIQYDANIMDLKEMNAALSPDSNESGDDAKLQSLTLAENQRYSMRKSSLLIADNLNDDMSPPKQRNTSHRFERRMRSDSLYCTDGNPCDNYNRREHIQDDPIEDSRVSESIQDQSVDDLQLNTPFTKHLMNTLGR